MLSPEDIRNLASLSRIELSLDEEVSLGKEVSSILGYVGEIQKLSGGEVKKEVGDVHNVFRADENPHLPGEFTEALLAEAPSAEDGYIRVKKIL